MPTHRMIRIAMSRGMALSLALAMTLGCGLHKATVAFDEGRYDDALVEYQRALHKDPNNLQAKIGVRKTAPLAAEQHLNKAKEAQRVGKVQTETHEVGIAVALDPANAVAVDWLVRLQQAAERRRQEVETEESIDTLKRKGEDKKVLPINPRSLEGMELNFSRKTSLKDIFSALSKNSGVNIVLHSSVSSADVQISVDLRGLSFQRVLDTLMLQSDLFYKVMDANSIMVFKKTPQNLQEYENKLIRTFYLSNADVENVRQIFNALMPQLRVFIDKRLNAITVMAKPNDLNIAQRIVNQLDKAKAEVMIYLELLEMAETDAEQLGILPVMDTTTSGTYTLGATYNALSTGGANSITGTTSLNSANINYLFPALRLDFAKTNGQTKLLANPNVRVISGETGEVNIGDKISTVQSQLGLPNTSTGSTSTTAAAVSTAFPTAQTSFSYEDVGVKIKVKPRVHFNGDITIELESNIKTEKAGGDPTHPNLSQREIKTSARLRDGETAIFGGMLKEEEQKNLQGIWGLANIPVIGDLTSWHGDNKTKTDVILTLRAVVVRKPDLAEDDFEAFDPDQAPSLAKPFAPQAPKAGPNVPMNAPPEAKPAPSAAMAPEPRPAVPAPVHPEAVDIPKPNGEALSVPPKGVQPEVAAAPTAVAKVEPAADAAAKAAPAETSDLVFFMNPLSLEVPKGQRIKVTLMASGGKGLTSGSMQLRLDPKLTLNTVTAGDFLTADGGSVDYTKGNDGNLTLNFKRKTGGPDGGTLAELDLQATTSGNAPILVQDGKYLVGANPISARVVNALITVL